MIKSSTTYPKAIVHIDGDCFFAACEVAKRPELKGKPVVTGAERGMVLSLSYEAKARGVKRGMTLQESRKVCPEVVSLPSDYETYSIMSQRMNSIVRRFTDQVEAYSIDECFADITGLETVYKKNYEAIALMIKKTLDQELGITFSVGLAPTKVLAKLGSKWEKPSGFTPIPVHKISDFLSKTVVADIWGIGPATVARLEQLGVLNADSFAAKSEGWMQANFHKPQYEIWQELRGEMVYVVGQGKKEIYQSISKTKTFSPTSSNENYVFSQLSSNIENACVKLRRYGLETRRFSFFLKTNQFDHVSIEIKLNRPTFLPTELLAEVKARFQEVFNPYCDYRTTGVVLMDLAPLNTSQVDLFGEVRRAEKMNSLFASIDTLALKYGKHVAFLGSSLMAMTRSVSTIDNKVMSERLFVGETIKKHLGLPFLGAVT